MLDELGRKHGTDKWDAAHSFGGESYLHVYERYFAPVRAEPLTLLELGVKSGASLRMWREYFPAADIHGVDLNPDCARHAGERITVHVAAQDDEGALAALGEAVGGFDIVIDDCSHINVLTVASHRILMPFVKPGGFYVIEDVGMSRVDYSELGDSDTFMDGELAMNLRRGTPAEQCSEVLDAVFDQIRATMDAIAGDIRFLHFWPNLAIMQKATRAGRPRDA